MADPELAIVTDPSPRDLAALDDRLYEFNAEATGHRDGRGLAIFVRDGAGALVAGLAGHTWGGCCEIKNLWIEPSRRRKGLGSRMLAAAEAEAARRGCEQVLLSTHSFQAPGFYRSRGYEPLATFDGYPRGHAQHWLRKQITPHPRGAPMSSGRKMLCVVYGLIAAGALAATWSQNLAFFASSPDAGVAGFIAGGYANPAAASLTNDLLFLLLAAVAFMLVEAKRIGVRFVWLYVVLSFVVAISVTFPLFLIARERRLAAAAGGAA